MWKCWTLEPYNWMKNSAILKPSISPQSYSLPTDSSSTLSLTATNIPGPSLYYITNPLPQLHSSVPPSLFFAWQPFYPSLSCLLSHPLFTIGQSGWCLSTVLTTSTQRCSSSLQVTTECFLFFPLFFLFLNILYHWYEFIFSFAISSSCMFFFILTNRPEHYNCVLIKLFLFLF